MLGETFECPNCGMESAYYDYMERICYCPDCDYEWKHPNEIEDDNDFIENFPNQI
ncbi:MAG: hypothetical protein LBN27_09180 [Prevotellaceae bacterium]|jgi:uncharacterized Zn ribbon protein|nr:hypothetical protein [Prevotellaceae bacterium]